MLSGEAAGEPKSADGPAEAIRLLRATRRSALKARTCAINQLKAHLVTADAGVAERHLEDHPEFEGKLTRRLARRLVGDVAVMPIKTAARRAGVSWHLVNDLVRAWAALVGAHRRRRPCRVLLVDETSMRRRQPLRDRHRLRRHRRTVGHGATSLRGGSEQVLASHGHRWCAGVRVVVSDGSVAYKTAIDRHLGHATHVLDRFGVIDWFAAGLTAVRRDIQRRQPAGVTPAFDPAVFRARFLLLRRPDRLDEAQRAQLKAIFAAHPRLGAAWEALGELHGLYLADDKAGALAALDRFTDLYQTGDLPEFYQIVNTLLAAMPRILAWHTTGRPSNGRIEGTNTHTGWALPPGTHFHYECEASRIRGCGWFPGGGRVRGRGRSR